jgi:hypothetical protein
MSHRTQKRVYRSICWNWSYLASEKDLSPKLALKIAHVFRGQNEELLKDSSNTLRKVSLIKFGIFFGKS